MSTRVSVTSTVARHCCASLGRAVTARFEGDYDRICKVLATPPLEAYSRVIQPNVCNELLISEIFLPKIYEVAFNSHVLRENLERKYGQQRKDIQ